MDQYYLNLFCIFLGRHFNFFYKLLIIIVINHEKQTKRPYKQCYVLPKTLNFGSNAEKAEYLPEFEIAVH